MLDDETNGDNNRQLRQAAIVQDYATTFGSEWGVRVLTDILRRAGTGSSSFVPKDSHEMAFNEGGRNLALQIIYMLNHTPSLRVATAQAIADATALGEQQ